MTDRAFATLTQLQQRIRTSIEEAFPLPQWISAEISEIKFHRSGHCYLELVEKGDNELPTASARAVIWRSACQRVTGYFEAETGRRLEAGLRILARCTVEYHPLYGLSLNIIDLDPAYTLGETQRARMQTIARLQHEGVWEMNRQLTLPAIVQRIAVISSRQAAGYRDFCMELESSPYAFRLRLFEASMQGQGAEASIIEALESAAACHEPIDAVVLIRGGGSVSDLNCFDSYRLCAHLAQFPLPVLTGIGHDKDTSVADLVAHREFKTPTAVAAWLVERMAEAEGWFDYAALRLRETALALTRSHELQLARMLSELAHRSSALLGNARLRTEQSERSLRDSTAACLQRCRTRLDSAAELVESRSPERILRLGFATVQRAGRTLRSADDVAAGDRLTIRLADGTVSATADDPPHCPTRN